MSWLVPSIIAALTGNLLVAAVYFYLWREDRQGYMGVWAAGWAFYAVRLFFELLLVWSGPSPLLNAAVQILSLLNGMLLMAGTWLLVGETVSRLWLAGGVAGVLWVLIASLSGFSFLHLSLPIFFFVGVAYIWTGAVLIRSLANGGIGKHVTGWALVAWGLHKLNYPFLRPLVWFAPLGYLLASGLALVVALGMLLIHFQKIKGELRASEEQYRGLLNNLDVGVARSFGNRLVQANPALARMLGYDSVAELLARPTSDLYAEPADREQLLLELRRAGQIGRAHV